MNINLKETEDGSWVATIDDNEEAIFSGQGKNMLEAIGSVLTANREVMSFTFEGTYKDGVKFRSTEYGRSRK